MAPGLENVEGGGGALAALGRWEASGATWKLVSHDGASATIALISCDGGEVMGRLVSSDPDFLAFVAGSA